MLSPEDFMKRCKSVFHVADECMKLLVAHGFKKIKETDPLPEKEPTVFVREGTCVVAYIPGTDLKEGFVCAGSHTDSPVCRFTKAGTIKRFGDVFSVPLDPYSGPVMARWLDRQLIVAGRVTYLENGKPHNKMFSREGFFIPQLAPHMLRGEPQTDWIPSGDDYIVCCGNIDGKLSDNMSMEAFIKVVAGLPGNAEVLMHTIEVCCNEVTCRDNLLHSGRQDNAMSVYASTLGLINSYKAKPETKHTRVIFAFHNEEIGSGTRAGASGPFMHNFWKRFVNSRLSDGDFYAGYAKSICCSMDGGHARHPIKGAHSCYEPVPLIGQGIILKVAEKQTYANTDWTTSAVHLLCKQEGITIHNWVQRSYKLGGATISKFAQADNDLITFDCGVPMLAMHSCVEIASLTDIATFTKFAEAVFLRIQEVYQSIEE